MARNKKNVAPCERAVIVDRDKKEKLVPVITYINGLSRSKSISAWLKFLSICHDDIKNKVRLKDILTTEDEAICVSLFDKVIDKYLKVNNLPKKVIDDLNKTAFKIIKKLSPENMVFIKDRFITICGEDCYHLYLEKYEHAHCFKDISYYIKESSSVIKLRRFTDFSIFFISLSLLYGCEDAYYERMDVLEKRLSVKYGKDFSFKQLGICLWPVNFSFVYNKEDIDEDNNENLALIKAAKEINPDTIVQAGNNSLLWARDIIAWLDNDYCLFAKSEFNDIQGQYGRGLLHEGGNIVTGTAIDKFILVAKGPFSDILMELDFYHEMYNRDIKIYAIPDGFLWSRNPETNEDVLLDSIHIDTVINIIPAQCTIDERTKIIVDPYYYLLIKDYPDFKKLLIEQCLIDSDIIIIDERELYLNLANFSVLLDQKGEIKLLFNKDKGYTIPRLKLKKALLIQTDIEITKMASSYGVIRCASNMLPESFIKEKRGLKINISDDISPIAKKKILELFDGPFNISNCLNKLYISNLNILTNPKEIPWEFDEFSRTGFVYLTPNQTSHPDECSTILKKYVSNLAEKLSQSLGIKFDILCFIS